MITVKPGWISQRLLLLGSRHFCLYLLKGRHCALLGGGVAWEVPRIESQLDRYGVDRRQIRYLVISHAHHDHCGAVPWLLKRYPHIQAVASEYGAHILNKTKPVDLMRRLNQETLDALGRPRSYQGTSLDFEPIEAKIKVNSTDQIDLGQGLSLRFYLTPGHSRCSLTTYVPEIKALFPADAVPIPDPQGNGLTVTANHDYDDYIASLKLLEPLPIDFIGYEHGGYLTGGEAETIIPRGLAATRKQRQRIVKRYEALNDLPALVAEIAVKYQATELFKLVPGKVMRAIIDRMVRSALGRV